MEHDDSTERLNAAAWAIAIGLIIAETVLLIVAISSAGSCQ